MNMRVGSLILVASAILTSGCVVGERHEATIQRRFPAAGINTLKVDEVDGSLSVQAGNSDEITLIAHVRSRGARAEPDQPNGGYFISEISGDTLRVGQKHGKVQIHIPFIFGSKTQIDYDLRVPARVALDLKTVNGRISTRGTEGEADITTVNGPIDIETGGMQEIYAKAVNGHVRAKFLRGFSGATLRTVNGGVEAFLPPTASFTCSLSQVNGDFEASFPLSIHSNPGSRRVSGEVNGGRYELQIATVNGDVEVQHVKAPVPPEPPPEVPAAPPAPAAPPGTR